MTETDVSKIKEYWTYKVYRMSSADSCRMSSWLMKGHNRWCASCASVQCQLNVKQAHVNSCRLMCVSYTSGPAEKLHHVLQFSPTNSHPDFIWGSFQSCQRRSRRSTWAEQLKPRLLAPKEPLTVVLCGFGSSRSLAELRSWPEVNLRHFNLWIDLVLKRSMCYLRKWHQLLQNGLKLLQNMKKLQSVLEVLSEVLGL